MGGPGSGPRRTKPATRGWRDWYQTNRWRRLAKAQLRKEPLCAACLANGKVTIATVADHVEHHDGNWNRFLTGRLQSLCAGCHGEKHGRSATPKPKFGPDGWPVS